MIWIEFFDKKENKIKDIKDSNKVKVIKFDFMVDGHMDQMYIYLEEKHLLSLTKPRIDINYKYIRINDMSSSSFIEKTINNLEYQLKGFFLDDSIFLRINQNHDIKITI